MGRRHPVHDHSSFVQGGKLTAAVLTTIVISGDGGDGGGGPSTLAEHVAIGLASEAYAIPNAIVDAKGDLIAATAADTVARLAVGTDGYVLTADAAATTGVKWAATTASGATQLASITAASAAIANTETVVVSASLAANSVTAGMSFRIRAAGVGTTAGSPGVDTFRVRIGTTTLTGNIPTSVAPAANASVTGQPFAFEALLTVRTAGAGGTIIGECQALGDDAAAGLFTQLIDLSATVATVALDTTAIKLLELTFQSGAAGSSATFHVATIEALAAASLASGSGVGSSELVYRYTVTGSDKASIDTGADTADAGSNDWTNGDVLEVWVIARTDEAAVTRSTATLVFNNDTGSNYDIEQFRALGTSVAGAGAVAGASLQIEVPGAGASANYASTGRATIAGFSGTTFYKTMEILTGYNHATAGSNFGSLYVGSWRSTSAITRVKLGCLSTNKLVVGSELLIYKRLAS